MNVTASGIDWATHNFSLHGRDACGKVVFNMTSSRETLPPMLEPIAWQRAASWADGGAADERTTTRAMSCVQWLNERSAGLEQRLKKIHNRARAAQARTANGDDAVWFR